MSSVIINGWTKGCDTISAIKEIRKKARMPLNEALDAVNRVLTNGTVEVALSSPAKARALAKVLAKMGLIVTTADASKMSTP